MRYKSAVRFCSVIVAAAAVYHLLAATSLLPIAGAHWRHALFVVIDSVFAGLLFLRPAWLFIPFAILTLYSLWSHGTHAWIVWHFNRQIDWLSLGVVVFMPVMLIVIILDAREQRRVSQSGLHHALK